MAKPAFEPTLPFDGYVTELPYGEAHMNLIEAFVQGRVKLDEFVWLLIRTDPQGYEAWHGCGNDVTSQFTNYLDVREIVVQRSRDYLAALMSDVDQRNRLIRMTAGGDDMMYDVFPTARKENICRDERGEIHKERRLNHYLMYSQNRNSFLISAITHANEEAVRRLLKRRDMRKYADPMQMIEFIG